MDHRLIYRPNSMEFYCPTCDLNFVSTEAHNDFLESVVAEGRKKQIMAENRNLPTMPQHLRKPTLQWVGQLLGCDIYADLQGIRNERVEKLRAAVEALLRRNQ